MNHKRFLLLICLFAFLSGSAIAKTDVPSSKAGLYFTENNGQLRDQYGQKRSDIQFSMQAPGLGIFIGNGMLHYQFTKFESESLPQDIIEQAKKGENYEAASMQGIFHTYRLDVALLGANNNAQVIKQDIQSYYENFYLGDASEGGVVAHTYKKITYKNVYPDIDWVIYIKGNKLEHEFIVGPHGDASQIRLKYSGQTSLKIDDNGGIIAATPMGIIKEQAPVCFRADGTRTPSAFKLDEDILTYDLKGYKGKVVIDPVLEWGTYYGPDTSTTFFYTVACHATYIYACGLTWANTNIATSGGYMATFAGGGTDAFLVKFDSSGARIWATYYGGPGGDYALAVACDQSGNIYFGGNTQSTTGFATPGCQQPAYGGGTWDGFVAKFDPSGARVWGTFLGGSGSNGISSINCDPNGHVYACGDSNDPNNISTPGTFQPVKAGGWDNFVVQYDSNGVRQWGTYLGGPANEFGGVSTVDGFGVFVAGWTSSATGISTPPPVHQVALAGSTDMYVMRLTAAGNRLWGSYYGGEGSESTGGITCDIPGNIFLFGSTSSLTGIATVGAAQATYGGGTTDAFLMKLEPENGLLLWGTYHGGTGDETATYSRITTDDSLRAYFAAITTSPTGIATPDAWQPFFAGGDNDAFVAMYSTTGDRLWCTYYGGNGRDDARGCAYANRALYVCGLTTSTDRIATPGAFLDTGGSPSGLYSQGFLVKFADTTAVPIDTTTVPDTSLYAGNVKNYTNAVIIMPNPTNGSFTVNGSLGNIDGVATLMVSNVAGRVIMHDEATVRNGIINKKVSLPQSTPPGIYFLKIVTKDKTATLKFLKE